MLCIDVIDYRIVVLILIYYCYYELKMFHFARVTARGLRDYTRASYLHTCAVPCGGYVERHQHLQRLKLDNDMCKQSMTESRFIVFAHDRPLLKHEDGQHSLLFTTYHDIQPYFTDEQHFISRSALLNVGHDFICQYAVTLPETAANDVAQQTGGVYLQTRSAVFSLKNEQSHLMSQAVGILRWNRHTKFCLHCGNKLIGFVSGWQKRCSSCQRVQYPHTSPVVITLVSNESNTACVLVHQPGHYKGMYTAVAGFLEIGEAVEDAVKREIAEEIGLEINSQRYLSSQHWPGPTSSLMIGCLAVTADTKIVVDKNELEDARWFTVDEVKQAMQNTLDCVNFEMFAANVDNKLMLPPRPAIAQDLVREWLNQIRN